MKKKIIVGAGVLITILILVALVYTSLPATAQDASQEPVQVESSIAVADAPENVIAVSYNSPPVLTEERRLQVERGAELANLSPVVEASGEVAGPMPGTESILVEKASPASAPLVPGDEVMYSQTQFGSIIPDGFKANSMDSSTDGKGPGMFYTGNWFAARSTDKGVSWSYLDPSSDFQDFCCGQFSLYDESRDIYLWMRTGTVDANGNNIFTLSVDSHDPFIGSYWTWYTAPINVNGAWTNQFWNAPTMSLGADYLYISMTMYNQSGIWLRSVVLRWPLDALAAGAGFSYNYYSNADWFTFMPVSGTSQTVYFASNWDVPGGAPWDTLAIWRWYEDNPNLTVWIKTIPAWTATGRGSMHCGTPNWLARGDQRLLTGARYEINNDGIAEPRQTGRKVLGWWWNVAEGGGFTHPYIEGAAFYEDTMTLLPGLLGRPYVYGSWCFAYPSFAPNNRGDLGGIFNYSTSVLGLHKPQVAYSIADDFWNAPPGWAVYDAVGSGAGPSDQNWGDFNTVRTYQSGTTWTAGSHYIPGSTNCSNCSVPFWFAFGRERDTADFSYSCRFFGSCIPLIFRK